MLLYKLYGKRDSVGLGGKWIVRDGGMEMGGGDSSEVGAVTKREKEESNNNIYSNVLTVQMCFNDLISKN